MAMFKLKDFFVKQDSINVIDEDNYTLNIQPSASILNVFSRLSYKAWYAIAEFVDNSTQSYLSHINELHKVNDFEKLVIKIGYNEEENSLWITDNAFGMEIDKFKDAILLDSKNDEQQGRNEFGMGLKTAASWFGNIWSVTSTQYGSENLYYAEVDIPKLKRDGLNSIAIQRKTVPSEQHGTTIIINDVTKKIASRTKGKVIDLLSSMYRRDINSRNIEIWFNDALITFDEYPILKNFRGKEWKKPLDFNVVFENQTYHVTGFVAIMNPGSFPKTGFALFRQDRVVVGGTDMNYKPSKIFGQVQSQISLKLFGELNMNDFPVNQAKDGFVWDDGLEDAFIDALKVNIQEYINIAALSIKERETENQYSQEKSEEVRKEIEKVIDGFNTESSTINEEPIHNSNTEDGNDLEEYIDTVLNIDTEEKTVGTVRSYQIPVDPLNKLPINVTWALGNKDYWIQYVKNENNEIDVTINIDHPFFMPYSKDENFKKVLEKFVLAFVVAEQQAISTSEKDGYILASVIKNNMNRYLSKLAGEI